MFYGWQIKIIEEFRQNIEKQKSFEIAHANFLSSWLEQTYCHTFI